MWRKPLLVSILLYLVTECQACCPDGWLTYRGSCYLFGYAKQSNFVTAENYCRQHGGHLIHPESFRVNEFIKTHLKSLQHETFWIGITDENIEGVWQLYGTDIDAPVVDWYPGQPNSHNGDEDCAAYFADTSFKWHDVHCSELHEPLCEKADSGDGGQIIG